MTHLWTDERQSRLAFALLIAFFLAFLSSLFRAGPDSALFQGDFASFYSAGRLVLEGRSSELYDLRSLSEIQQRYWPEAKGVFPMAYPAFYAVLFAPLTAFPPMIAKTLFCTVLLVALYGAVHYAASFVAIFSGKQFVSCRVFLLSYPPLFHGMSAAQNTTLSMLLLAGALYFIRDTSRQSDIKAGAFLGLWLFKPHLSGLVILVFLLAKRFRILWGLIPVAVIYYLLGIFALGWDWPLDWKQNLDIYVAKDYLANQYQMVSILGGAHALSDWFSLAPDKKDRLVGIAFATSALIAFAFLTLAWQRLRDPAANRYTLTRMALLAVGLSVLVSPHTVYYDMGLLLIPIAYFLPVIERPLTVAVVVYLFSAVAVLVKDRLPAQPLITLSIASFIFMLWAERRIKSDPKQI